MSSNVLKPATTYPAIVGNILGYLRNQRGLDQGQLAKIVGVTQSTWSRIERGLSGLTVDQLAAAAQALGVKPEQIVAWADQATGRLEKQGVKVELKRASNNLGPGLVLIGAAALALLLAAILSKSK